MTSDMLGLLPPTATDVDVQEHFDPSDPFYAIAGVADAELVDVLVSDFLGLDLDDTDDGGYRFSDHVVRYDQPEPPIEWDDYTIDDYRLFVGL